MHSLTPTGCAPIPLAHSMKALGIVRLVSKSQRGDPGATACRKGDQFVLHSRFDRGAFQSISVVPNSEFPENSSPKPRGKESSDYGFVQSHPTSHHHIQ